jgi:NADH-quinone oxidoreductase subunit J
MFYLLAILSVISALHVIHSSLPVRSLVHLVVTFVFCGGILVSLGLEFLGLTLIVVYAGALVILFLFVVKTLNIRREQDAASLSKNYSGLLYRITPLL